MKNPASTPLKTQITLVFSFNLVIISIYFALFPLLFPSTHSLQAAELPDLGSSDLIEYNIALEKELGRAFNTALHTQFDLNSDPDVLTYIRNISHNIASQTGKKRSFKFYVINDNSINAFAGPDGIIGIHTGLISAVKNEDELASVIAHEIAHVTQQHLSRAHEINSQQGNLTSLATLLTAILVGMHDSSAIYPTLMAGVSLNIEQQLKNSRLYEFEADNIGIKYLSQAGYNPHAMGSFFGRLANAYQNNEFQIPEILRSHPVTNSRIVEAEHRAQNLPPKHLKKKNNHFALIQLKLQTKNHPTLPINQQNLTADEKCYLSNLKHLLPYSSNPTPPSNQTILCLQSLVKKHPNHFLYTTLLFKRLTTLPNISPTTFHFAQQQAEYLLALYPNNTALLLTYTELLLHLNKTQEAIRLLTQHTNAQTYSYQPYKKLSEIYASQSKPSEAYFFLALAQFNIGNLKKTNYLLKLAEKQADQRLKQQIKYFQHKNRKLLKLKQISDH